MKRHYSDSQIINGIITRDNLVLKYLYEKYLEKAIKYVTNNKGNKQEAEDVFQNSIVKMLFEVKKKNFKLNKTFEAYFTSIYQNTWKYEVKFKNKQNTTSTFPDTLAYEETNTQYEIKLEQYRKLTNEEYNKLDTDSQKLLDLFYYKKKTMAEIAYKMDYKDGKSAKTLKCRAVSKLKSLIKSTTIFKNLQND